MNLQILDYGKIIYNESKEEIILNGKYTISPVTNSCLIFLISSDIADKNNSSLRKNLYKNFNVIKIVENIQREEKKIKFPAIYPINENLYGLSAKKFSYNKFQVNEIYSVLQEFNSNFTENIDRIFIPLELFGLEDKLNIDGIIKKIKKTFNLKDIEVILINKLEIL